MTKRKVLNFIFVFTQFGLLLDATVTHYPRRKCANKYKNLRCNAAARQTTHVKAINVTSKATGPARLEDSEPAQKETKCV